MTHDQEKLSFVFKYALQKNMADWTLGPVTQNDKGFATSEFTNKASGEKLTVAQLDEDLFNIKGKNMELNANLPNNWQIWPR